MTQLFNQKNINIKRRKKKHYGFGGRVDSSCTVIANVLHSVVRYCGVAAVSCKCSCLAYDSSA